MQIFVYFGLCCQIVDSLSVVCGCLPLHACFLACGDLQFDMSPMHPKPVCECLPGLHHVNADVRACGMRHAGVATSASSILHAKVYGALLLYCLLAADPSPRPIIVHSSCR